MRKYELSIKDKTYVITVKDFSTEKAELEINGETMTVQVSNVEHASAPLLPLSAKSVSAAPKASAPTSSQAKPAKSGDGDAVLSPIPGQILEIFVKEGDKLNAGQPVLKMEAMKMENIVNAPAAGTVASILVGPGDAVSQGQELVLLG